LFPPLILASTSPYRRALLTRLALPFSCVSPGLAEEHLLGEAPAQRALRLSRAKALAVAARHPGAVVIGSDQVAAQGDRALDKPGDAAGARAQLGALGGRSALFHTGCAVAVPHGGLLEHLDTTTVQLRPLDPATIERYITLEQPFDCAGSFKVESAGIALFERIESVDPTALIGLPLIWLAGALRRAGFQVP
jgi:septum formation protein